MGAIFEALAPVFLLIAMGYAIRRYRWIDDAFWPPAERLTYRVLFPALLIASTARANLASDQVWAIAGALFVATLVVAGAALALKPVLGLRNASFTSFFQGAIRPNTYVGMVPAFLFWGDEGLAMLSIGVLAVVPLVNLLSVTVLVIWGDGHEGARTPMKAVREVVRNPLVVACLIGFGLNALDIGLPPVIAPLLDILGRAALPIALMAVGAGLDFPDLLANRWLAGKATVLKLLVLPALAWGLATAFGLDGQAFQVVMLYATLPMSASSYVLAREMGGDAPLAAGMITASTVAAMITMTLWIVLSS
ncbi:AEC family transporter [Magnetovibrio sp.]|uniref:AEC family transporter n=1 Tax=Magnetovibrio sp. TaxID=2024836 RepID=UPI002F94EE6C